MRIIQDMLSFVMQASKTSVVPAAPAGSGFTRKDVRIKSAGIDMAAWQYIPDGASATDRRPAIVMAHGWSAVKEMYLDDFAAKFAAGGFVVTVFDYRTFGGSEGMPRQHISPAMQHEDYRNAITWTQLQPMVDPDRIGIWGSSYSGGHVLHLAAYDRRVKAVVAQVPLVDAVANFRRLVRNDAWPAFHAWLASDRQEEYKTGKLGYVPVVDEQGKPQALPTPDSYEWFIHTGKTRAPSWKNEQTLRSLELALEYKPAAGIQLISPTRGGKRCAHPDRSGDRGLQSRHGAEEARPHPGRPLRRLHGGLREVRGAGAGVVPTAPREALKSFSRAGCVARRATRPGSRVRTRVPPMTATCRSCPGRDCARRPHPAHPRRRS